VIDEWIVGGWVDGTNDGAHWMTLGGMLASTMDGYVHMIDGLMESLMAHDK